MGKSSIDGSFSMAMLNNQRVYVSNIVLDIVGTNLAYIFSGDTIYDTCTHRQLWYNANTFIHIHKYMHEIDLWIQGEIDLEII